MVVNTGNYKPERERLPSINKIHNSSMGGAVIWCPKCRHKLIYERINFNNYICTHCWYELPKPGPQQVPENATISTIDGWVDLGYTNTGTKTAKFRPVESSRKDEITKTRQFPLLHPLDPEIQAMVDKSNGAMTITGSEVIMNRSDDIIDRSNTNRTSYKSRRRTRELY
jgi:ribosomal protein L37AE/L43A